jgi:hypothetical protein
VGEPAYPNKFRLVVSLLAAWDATPLGDNEVGFTSTTLRLEAVLWAAYEAIFKTHDLPLCNIPVAPAMGFSSKQVGRFRRGAGNPGPLP